MPSLRTIVGFAVTAALAAAGCGGADIEAFCEAREDCLGGNEKDLEACIAIEELREDIAGEIGCADELEDYTTCRIERASCEDLQTGLACTTDDECRASGFVQCSSGQCIDRDYIVADPDACKTETTTYQRCN